MFFFNVTKTKRHNSCMNFVNILQVFIDGNCYWKMEAKAQALRNSKSLLNITNKKNLDYMSISYFVLLGFHLL